MKTKTPRTKKKPSTAQSKRNTIKRTTRNNQPPKSRVDFMRSQGFLRTCDPKLVRAVAEELLEWAINNPEAKSLETFYVAKRILWDTVADWRKKFPFFDEAVKFALMAVGTKLENGLIECKYNPYVAKILHLYVPRAKETDQYHINLKQQADAKTAESNIQWVIRQFPNSDIVPPKPKKGKRE